MVSKTPLKAISSRQWERWQTHAPRCSWNCSCGTAQTWWWIFKAAETTGPDEWHKVNKRSTHHIQEKIKEKGLQVYHPFNSVWFFLVLESQYIKEYSQNTSISVPVQLYQGFSSEVSTTGWL